MSRKISEFGVLPEQLQKLNEIVLQEDFRSRIDEVRKINVTLTQKPTQGEINFSDFTSSNNSVLSLVEPIGKYDLDPQSGNLLSEKIAFSGYDESKYKFLTLEGIANVTTHSLVTYVEKDLFPVSIITFYFYTRSNKIIHESKFIRYSEDSESDSNRDYAEDRSRFIKSYALNNTVIFIDGPLIGGNISSYTLELVDFLHANSVIPLFFVKNSNSNLVVDNIEELKNNYNSDLHWSYQFLNHGQRSNIFLYTDKHNSKNTKMFCYIKPFNSVTTQRIEFHPDSYKMYKNGFEDLFDLIYYLMIAHGDKSNPQIRPIANAERYARETMNLINIEKLLGNSSLIQTMDQTRFGG